MLKVRERNNTWPSFVDLFSNLVIIMIFILIVFIFLWTATSVFQAKNRMEPDMAERLAAMRELIVQQDEELRLLREDDSDARALLIAARDELLALEYERAAANAEKELLLTEQLALIEVYETKLREMQNDRESMIRSIERLSEQLRANQENQMDSVEMRQRAASLQLEIERMNNALVAAEAARAEKEVEFAALSERLNKAMADRLSEMNAMRSEFYGAIREALGDFDQVDTSTERFVIPSDILFASGQFQLSADGRRQIQIIADIIKDMEQKIDPDINWIIRVDGHADRIQPRPNPRFRNNMELSLLRARSVVNEFIRAGVPAHRLIPAGFGELFPLNDGLTPEELQKNRRIELRLTNQ